MAQITLKKWAAITVLAMLLQSMGLILFILGFFPVKPALKGISGIESLNPACSDDLQHISTFEGVTQFQEKLEIHPQYDRIVLMVIDGLPAEFLLGKGGLPPSREMAAAMPFTQSLLSTKKAIGFHVKAAAPTVTMPRLKAITSGAIAGFLDVAFNFNTQVMLGDNLIGQLGRLGWKMVMYGDETWLRLFPNAFVRHDGVSSFYVKDTIQVDRNVTQHLDAELVAHDWDLLILHYLGLDHVGHLGGRTSPLMAPKLKEMDDVIQHLHASLIENKSTVDRETLLMVVSDHGMTHGGNHGGASFEETDALALFIRKRVFSKSMGSENDQALQVDLVPTLALLLGVPIPKNNVGVLLPELFDTLTAQEKLRALEVNSWQIMRLLKVRSPKSPCLRSLCSGQAPMADFEEKNDDREITKFCNLFREAEGLHKSWKDPTCNKEDLSCTLVDWEVVFAGYLSFLHAASDWLARGTTEKSKLLVYNGGFLMLLSTTMFIGVSVLINKEVSGVSKNKWELWISKLENGIALAGVFGHALSLNSSSLVEEEQFTLHFLVVTLWFSFLRRTCQQASLFYQPVLCQSFTSWWNLLPSARQCMDEGGEFDGKSPESWDQGACDRRKVVVQVVAIVTVLVTGRLMRGWHRSGVNWAHLPDVAKWLDQADSSILLATQLVSLAAVTVICCGLVLEQTPRNLMQRVVAGSLTLAALLILFYRVRTKDIAVGLTDQFSIKLAQLVYALLGCTTLVILFFTPWFVSSFVARRDFVEDSMKKKGQSLLAGEQQLCLNLIGKVFISCWCLLQLLLQQPVNSVPVLLLLLQLISCLVFFNLAGSTCSSWLKVLTLYWMGASGHFGMGNTNTLATVDVSGAYIGLSQHSIFLSGLLAFMITYSAPLLYMMGLLLMASMVGVDNSNRGTNKQRQHWLLEAIALPCTCPLALSSIILLVFTLVMLLMQGHLFIWSVFSPKYIYVCFTIFSTYLGVIINTSVSFYTCVIVGKSFKQVLVALNY